VSGRGPVSGPAPETGPRLGDGLGLDDGPELESAGRPEIRSSWRRCLRSGLRPEAELQVSRLADFDRRSRLLTSAGPVLDGLARHLEGTAFSLLLADGSGCLVDLRCGKSAVRTRVERSGAVIGQLFSESATGTNAIATSIEQRRGLFVRAGEHFLQGFKCYSCYGQPVFNRATRRLEGVLDITCAAADDNELLKPFVSRVASDIEDRLLETGHVAQKRMLDAFQEAAAGRPGILLVLGDGVHLETPAASALLDAADRALIGELAADLAGGLPGTRAAPRRLVLSGGVPVSLELDRVSGTGTGVLCRIEKVRPALVAPVPVVSAPRSSAPDGHPGSVPLTLPFLPGLSDLPGLRESRTRVLVHGETGSGRTTALAVLAGAGPLAVLHAGELVRDGAAAWLRRLETLLADQAYCDEHGGLVAIEEIQLLSPELGYLVAEIVRASPAWVAASSAPLDDLRGGALGLVSYLPGRIPIPALRTYREQIPALLRAMAVASGSRPRRLSAAAQAILISQPWPGNLRELAGVAAALHSVGATGEIQPAQLPEGYRQPGMPGRLTRLEQAERDAIWAALRANGGNKAKTAAYLGISRTTLYKALRSLGIWA
jgi:sigma-54 dependent transcriptional regulator, acetoin dehydrogenase operon transcriptional activator AcoR